MGYYLRGDQKTLPEEGIEPSRTEVHQILSLARLPVPPLRLGLSNGMNCISTRPFRRDVWNELFETEVNLPGIEKRVSIP